MSMEAWLDRRILALEARAHAAELRLAEIEARLNPPPEICKTCDGTGEIDTGYSVLHCYMCDPSKKP